jgi:hypothetical protein
MLSVGWLHTLIEDISVVAYSPTSLGTGGVGAAHHVLAFSLSPCLCLSLSLSCSLSLSLSPLLDVSDLYPFDADHILHDR